MLMPAGGSTARNSQFGARKPGDVSHCSMWAAVSACRALRSSRSRVREIDAAGVHIVDASLRPPTLDEVFLRLTARKEFAA